MDIENQPGSDLKRRVAEAMLAVYFALAPSTVPPWRRGVSPPPAAVLLVGDPVPRIGA